MEGEAPSLVLFHVFSKKGGRLGSYFPPRNIRKEQAHTGAQVQGEAFPLEGRNGQKSSASLVEQNITFFFFPHNCHFPPLLSRERKLLVPP